MLIPNSDFVGSAAAPPCLVRASGRSTAAAGEAAWRFGESRRRLRAVVAGWSWKHLAEGTGGRDRVGNAASARSTVTESGGGLSHLPHRAAGSGLPPASLGLWARGRGCVKGEKCVGWVGAGNERGVKGAVSGSVQRNEATASILRCPTHLLAGFCSSLSQKPNLGAFGPVWGPAGLPRCLSPLVPTHPKWHRWPQLSGIPQAEPAPERGKTPNPGGFGVGGALLGARLP